MKYQVLFRIEKYELVDKLFKKVTNLKKYFEETNQDYEMEIVFAGPVVKTFKENCSRFYETKADIVVCHNALKEENMKDINSENIRTVKAGIGEIIEKKAQGWVEYTIE